MNPFPSLAYVAVIALIIVLVVFFTAMFWPLIKFGIVVAVVYFAYKYIKGKYFN